MHLNFSSEISSCTCYLSLVALINVIQIPFENLEKPIQEGEKSFMCEGFFGDEREIKKKQY